MTLPLITVLLTIALATAVWWSIPAFSGPALPFGVRVPPARVADPAVATAHRDFTRRIVAVALAAAVVGLPLTIIGPFRLVLPVLTGALVLADTVIYVLAHRFLRTAKREGDWYADTRQGVTADLSLRSDPVRVPWRWLIPALAIAAVTTVLGTIVAPRLPSTLPALDGLDLGPGKRVDATFAATFTPVLTQAGMCLATALAAFGLPRTRPDLDASQPAASARRYRRYLRALMTLLFAITALANLTMLGIALRLWELVPASIPATLVIFAPLAVTVLAVVVFQVRVGHAGHRLAAEPGDDTEDSGLVQRDDDRHWHLGGFVYVNRDDPAIFVHQRVGGAKWTVNLGNPAGLSGVAVLVAIGIAVAVLSVLGVIDLPSK